MNMLDGMDVMIISYAAPTIATEWTISPQILGNIFSAGLFGMALGTLFIAPRADIIGRRNIILFSALIMGATVLLTCFAQNATQLVYYRFISGLGIGSMLASTATLTAEYAPQKTKDFWISFVMSGYPIGAVLSGMIAAKIIPIFGWRTMFQFAGIATLLTLPFVYFFLIESIDFLIKKQPKNALQKVNIILTKMKQNNLAMLPPLNVEQTQYRSAPLSALLQPSRRIATFQLWFALFMAFATLYFLTTWIPKLATITGLTTALSIYAGTIFNIGAFLGIVTQGYLSTRFGLKLTISGFLLLTALLMVTFAFCKGAVLVLLLLGMIGFCIQGGFVGLYAVAAGLYPTEIRSTGVGFAMSSGRLGGIVSPSLGGWLISIGISPNTNFIIFAVPAFLAAIVVYLMAFSKNI